MFALREYGTAVSVQERFADLFERLPLVRFRIEEVRGSILCLVSHLLAVMDVEACRKQA